MQSLARVCQNRASEAKRALVAGCQHKIILYVMMWNLKVPPNKNLRLTPSANLDLITCISPFPRDLIYSPYSPKVLVFSPNARPFFPNFNSLWVQASRRDLSVLAQAFHTRSYKISRLHFNDIIFYPITNCLLKRLQRIQFEAASFVFGRYVNNFDSILRLGWLPMKERREWHVLKAAHKAWLAQKPSAWASKTC